MMTGIPIENNLWTAYLLTIFFVVAGFAVYDVLYRRVPDRVIDVKQLCCSVSSF